MLTKFVESPINPTSKDIYNEESDSAGVLLTSSMNVTAPVHSVMRLVWFSLWLLSQSQGSNDNGHSPKSFAAYPEV